MVGEGDGLDPGHAPDVRDGLFDERRPLRFRGVFLRDERDVAHVDVGRPESRVELVQPEQAAAEQAGAREQHERQADLEHDEQAAPPVTTGSVAGTVAAILECFRRVDAGSLEGGDQAEGHAGAEGEQAGKGEHRAVHGNFLQPRQSLRRQGDQCAHAAVAHEHAQRATEHGNQQAFAEELAHNAAATGAEHDADRDFPVPRAGPGQQQVGHVHAGDQEQEGDGAQQHEQQRLHAAHLGLQQGLDSDARKCLCGRRVRRLPAVDPVHFLPGLRERNVRLEASQHQQGLPGGIARKVQHAGRVEIRAPVELVSVGHDADDGAATFVEADALADHGGPATELAQPQVVAEEHNVVLAGLVFPRLEIPPEGGSCLQDAEIGRRDALREDAPGLALAGEIVGPVNPGGERGESPGLAGPREKIGRRGARLGAARRPQAQHHQLGRAGIVQRTQQHAVDHAEDGRGGADAEGQREDGDDGEAGMLAQHPQAETQVTAQGVEPRPAVLVAGDFLELFDAAEFPLRGKAGLLAGKTRGDKVVGALLQVQPHFLRHVRLPLPPAEQGAQPQPGLMKQVHDGSGRTRRGGGMGHGGY